MPSQFGLKITQHGPEKSDKCSGIFGYINKIQNNRSNVSSHFQTPKGELLQQHLFIPKKGKKNTIIKRLQKWY